MILFQKYKNILLVFVLLGGAFFYFYQGIYWPPSSISEKKIFSIKSGAGVKEIAQNLEREGFVKKDFFFSFYVYFSKSDRNLKAGKYFLNSSMTVPEIAAKIMSGEADAEKMTIVEGWNLKNIAEQLERMELLSSKEFFDIAEKKDFSQEFDFLKDKSQDKSLEGYLFPDTYFISAGESAEAIVRKMLANFSEKLSQPLRAEISRQKKTIFEIITMASLIEKEVRIKEEKELVSGILWKRLKESHRLEVDAIINYITGKNSASASFVDLAIDSPYNTYKYYGLPPGPISNPGLESILAAIYPKESEYWFYLSTPDGKTLFSKTLDEHNLKKAKYLR